VNFWYIVRVVTARWWIVAGLTFATLLVILVAAPAPKVTYEAICRMRPTSQAMREGTPTTSNNPQATALLPDRNVILSNLVILAQSEEVFTRAGDFLALSEDEQRRMYPGLPSYKRIPRILYESDPDKPITPKEWQDALQVGPEFNPNIGGDKGTTSDVIRIKVKLPNGDEAAYIANAVGVAFSEAYERISHEEIQKTIGFLEDSLEDSKKKLAVIEAQITDAKLRHKIVAVDSETQAAVTESADIEVQRNTAQASVDEAVATLSDIDRQLAHQPLVKNDTLPADLNPTVIKLKEELAQAEEDLRSAALRYTPEHTVYKSLEARVKALKDRIAQEGSSYNPPTVNDLHNSLVKQRSDAANHLASATAKLRALNAQVATAQHKLAAIPGAQQEIAELNREQQRANEDYAMFAQKLAEAKIAEREYEKAGSIIPYGWASNAIGPVVDGPRRRTLLAYGFILSLLLGVALLVWMDSLDNRVRNGKDVEELLGLPAIGLIPVLEGPKGQLPRLTHIFPLSAAAESYRLLRTHILFAYRDKPFKTLMVASPKPGQGATTTICNLAIALAQIGKKIVLIDADMRRPSLHEFFYIPNENGLSTILQGKGNPYDCIVQTGIDNLIVIPAGPPPLNPSELLASDRMWEIVKLLEERCDMVLFDTPSTVVFSDGPVLASWLDAVLFVINANQVPRGTERQALDMLRKAKANIIGTVVNRLGFDSVDSCHFHSRYYASSMGDTVALPEAVNEDGKGKGGVAALAEPSQGTEGKKNPASEQDNDRDGGSPFPD
jgi:polysaccharide biosynthesis transport protein